MEGTAWVQVTTTTATEQEADDLAGYLLEARLAACVQTVGPIRSRYWWQGRIEQATEWLCLCKTTADRVDALVAAVSERHSYDVPEVLAMPVSGGSAPYLAWVADEVQGAAG